MKQLANEMYKHEFNREVKIEESEDEEEIPTRAIDEDQDSVDEKNRITMEDLSKPLVSYEISDEEKTETIVV